ncbi:hypothetical protein YC2023_041106 [Brassica napus]
MSTYTRRSRININKHVYRSTLLHYDLFSIKLRLDTHWGHCNLSLGGGLLIFSFLYGSAGFKTSLQRLPFVLLEDKQKGKSVGVIYHGFYQLSAMVYRCFRNYLCCFRVLLALLQVQG